MEVEADVLPVGPAHVREDLLDGDLEAPDKRAARASHRWGTKVREMQARGETVPPELQEAFDEADAALCSRTCGTSSAAASSRRHRRGADRAGDPRVLLGLRRARDRGLWDDGDLDRGYEQPAVAFRFGSVGKPFPGCEMKIAADGEILLAGRTSSAATTRTRTRPLRLSSTAGCTPATSARSTKTAISTSQAARRTSSSPRAARTSPPPTSRTASSRTSTSHRRSCTVTAGRT